MAPARSTRRTQHEQSAAVPAPPPPSGSIAPNDKLFLEPMMGTPLAMYVEKDVDDRDAVVASITKRGGTVTPGYSGTPYLLVDPHKESGQNLYRQYVGKKGKMVLHYRWVQECIRANVLQTFQTNWAGCKVTGTEKVNQPPIVPSQSTPQAGPPQPMPPMPPPGPLVHPPPPYPYPVFAHPISQGMQPPTAGPPQSWQAPNAIAPQQTHIAPPPPPPPIVPRPADPYRQDSWEASFPQGPPPPHMVGGPGAPPYDYRYRDDQTDWTGPPHEYTYDQSYDQAYDQAGSFMPEAGPSTAGPSTVTADATDKPRGRKRTRTQATPAAPPSTLVLNRRNPAARSPTPPSRVIKSTYGGNLFTSDDVLYLKKYIDYCQEQGLVLSLREICERVAIKAPHHTFYSWRRYCNKHQIRLGGYSMDAGDTGSQHDGEPEPEEEEPVRAGTGPGIIAVAQQRMRLEGNQPRNRSPTPPRALFRSTTGKGVAFTDEDVTFLVRFMEYRKSQDRFDMVAFWKDVATKVAPHHSRASWMKFWRRHKHELNHTEQDEPLPQPPEKKMRYSRGDDILLAKYFYHKPEGTSDKIFQAFGRMHPHHPWKGWQEHHRIHKAKIDHFIQQLSQGVNIDIDELAPEIIELE
ncbi:hypothetical protein BV22DRAFT_1006901 [Leucogyrophana mollusca]|uniref:Uncharacterized protein n=1 Tax=Leucogyrophana mollusca TaxID=85980 RepID=A0ACB8BPE9_9AGAM|nr:hypothetical protein BV22DRAFT_1006901 [Leucogyrophana mollusca]